MSAIQIFKNEHFGEVRVTEVNGDPMFCLVDVAKALGYKNPAKAVIDHCKGVTVLETPTNGGTQSIKFGREGDMYRLVLKSNAPKAEEFQAWVCDEVLPTLRKTGRGERKNPTSVREKDRAARRGKRLVLDQALGKGTRY